MAASPSAHRRNDKPSADSRGTATPPPTPPPERSTSFSGHPNRCQLVSAPGGVAASPTTLPSPSPPPNQPPKSAAPPLRRPPPARQNHQLQRPPNMGQTCFSSVGGGSITHHPPPSRSSNSRQHRHCHCRPAPAAGSCLCQQEERWAFGYPVACFFRSRVWGTSGSSRVMPRPVLYGVMCNFIPDHSPFFLFQGGTARVCTVVRFTRISISVHSMVEFNF